MKAPCREIAGTVLRLSASLLVLTVLAVPAPGLGQDPGERVYLTREEAFREIFPDLEKVVLDVWRLSPPEVERIETQARSGLPGPDPTTFRLLGPGGSLLGYAMVLDEKGKYRPITFMVGLGPDLQVRGVEVMVYREDRGDEVRYGRFLRQYRGRGREDPVRIHRDIVNVTGATISVRSLNRGVRRALETMALVYGGEREAGPVASRPVPVATSGES